jgi:outer membrane autotransporter protein
MNVKFEPARKADLQNRLLAATSAFALAIGTAHGAHAASHGGYEPYPISTDPKDWVVDRSGASTFENIGTFEGRDDVLRMSIEPPADSGGSYYNWQGYSQRTAVPAGDSFLRGDLWIADGWQNGTDTDFVHTGMWGSAMPEDLVAKGAYVDAAAVFPIVHFTNEGGVGRLVVWDPSTNPEEGWIDLPETAGLIEYDGWNTIDLRLLPEERKVEYRFNGQVIYTWDMPMPDDPALGAPEQFFAMYLKARNNGVAAFDTHWSRLLSGLLIRDGEAITETEGDVLIDPDEGSRVVVVGDGADIGGSILSDGGEDGALVTFGGSAAVGGDVIGNNTVFQFGTDPDDVTVIGGDVDLENGSTTGGGSPDNPIQVTGNVRVDDSSTLGGNWDVGGDLDVDGTLSPGNSIGTVAVAGNHAFGAAAVYEAEIDAAGQADRLEVGGTATLDGTVRVIPLDGPNDVLLGQPYTVVTANGGFGGSTFDGATWDHESAFLAPSLSYDANAAYVTIDRNGVAFASVAATPNQAAAAAGLDSLSFGNAAHDAVALSSAAVARQAFDALSGEIHASTRSALLDDSRHLRAAVTGRLRDAFEPGGNAAAGSGDARPIAGTSATVWLRGFGSWGQLDGDGTAAEVDRDTGGVVFGVDGPISESWRVGFAGGYSHTSLDADAHRSSASVDSYHVSVYGGARFGGLGLRLGAAHSWHGVETDRSISFSGFSDSVAADYDARTAQLFGEVGYAARVGGVGVEPFGGFSYVHLVTDDFTEDGGDAALSGSDDSDDLAMSTLGARAAKSFAVGEETRLTMRGMVGWRHAYGDVSPSADLAFEGGTSFAVEGAPLARDAAVVEAGLDLHVGSGVSVGAAYAGQIGDDAEDHGVAANLTVKF